MVIWWNPTCDHLVSSRQPLLVVYQLFMAQTNAQPFSYPKALLPVS